MKKTLKCFSFDRRKKLKKAILTMKLLMVLTLVAALNVSAIVHSQDNRLSIQAESIKLRDLLREIESKSNYAFFFNDQYSDLEQKVTLKIQNENIEYVLGTILKNTSLWYKVLSNNFVVIGPKESLQERTVSGKVVDNDGNPLAGVNVVEKGTLNGTATDVNGNFSLRLTTENPVLVFSFIGYNTEEIEVAGKTTINVQMIATIEKLDEVVVVGYGTMRKRDVTGSLVRVDEQALKDVPSANIQLALQGKAAGLEIQKLGTKPGAGALIRIRGNRSILGSNDPLIVVDGIPFEGGNLNDINPNDIASIEVLKDASATAIYGSRGANGVILITTKRGKVGETKLDFNSYYGVTTVARRYPVYNAAEYKAMRDISLWTGYMPEELKSLEIGRETDWQGLIYKNGYVTENNLTISGGNENNQYSIGGSYFKETTVLPGQDFGRITLRATGDFKVTKKVKVGLNTMNSLTINNGPYVNPMYPILTLSPLMPAYDEDGKIYRTPSGNPDDTYNYYNPLLLLDERDSWDEQIRRIRTFNSLYGEYEIIDGLKYRLNVGLDYRRQEFNQFYGADSYFRIKQGNRARVENGEGWGYTIENIMTFDKTFLDKHRINFTALYSAQRDHNHNMYLQKDSIIADFIKFYDLGQSYQTPLPSYGGSESTWSLISYMARLNYSFANKYIITLTARRDGTSRLAKKWHDYPAISIGYNVHEEEFMKILPFITILKLRAGWGETSNQAVSPYATLGGVSGVIDGTPVKYNFGNTVVNGYYVSNIPNKSLDWEYTKVTNLGLDFGVLRERITGTVDVYFAKTHKILYSQTLPPTAGVRGAYYANIGEMENKGIEISISTLNIKTANGFTWNTDITFFLNRNKLLKLYSGFQRDIANALHIGYPITAIYDYKKLGIWQLDEANEAALYGQRPGEIKIADINGDGQITPDDRTIIGDCEAKWQGGMTNRFKYKIFDFSFVLYTRMGGTIISAIHQPNAAYLTNLNGRRNGLRVNYWTPTNPSNDFPYPGYDRVTPPKATTAWSTLGYFDGSFIKVRSINFGVSLPSSIINKAGIKSLRIYFTAQNPFLLYAPYVEKGGVDPEPTGIGTTGFVSSAGNISNRMVTISLNTPPTSSYMIGINLGL